MEHEVLGTVYRVALLNTGNRGEQGMTRSSEATVQQPSSSDRQRSRSLSSGSVEDRTKRRAAKTAKTETEAEGQRKKAEQEKGKPLAQRKKAAPAIVVNVTKLVANIKTNLGQPEA